MGEDTESVMGGVRMGVNVDIKRTDGKRISIRVSVKRSTVELHVVICISSDNFHTIRQTELRLQRINGSSCLGDNQSSHLWNISVDCSVLLCSAKN